MVDLDAEMDQDVEAPTGESKTEEARVSKNVTLSGLQIYDDADGQFGVAAIRNALCRAGEKRGWSMHCACILPHVNLGRAPPL